MTVLVLAREFDPTADAVVADLAARRVPVFRADLASFPTSLWLEARLREGAWTGRLWTRNHSVALEDIRSIWHRNPSTFHFNDSLSEEEREFCYRESKFGIGGVLAGLDVLWANHPNRCADAMFKPLQWILAASCGFAVADTMITNDANAARRFADARAPLQTVTKALGPAGIVEHRQVQVAHTRRVTTEDLTEAAVGATATTLQGFVPKAFEVRLTVIGQEMFPIAIHADSDAARTDWRCDPTALRYEQVRVPDRVADGVSAYMQRAHLAYAGFDFVVTPGGEWVMLEANTGPQFGWLEAATGVPMAAAMATLLAEGRP